MSYSLPQAGSDLIAEDHTISVTEGQTLADIAEQYSLGFNELVAANSGLDPWIPKPGSQVTLPAQTILPEHRSGVVINLAEYRLYYFPPMTNKVITYPVGIGRIGWDTPVTKTRVTGKNKDPWWRVPQSVRQEHRKQGRELPEMVRPGKDNPLGGYAINLGLPGYLLHGTNKGFGIGTRVSHGCIRLRNTDIEALYQQLPEGTEVSIMNQPVKVGWHQGKLMLEVHPALEKQEFNSLTPVTAAIVKHIQNTEIDIDWDKVLSIARKQQGIVQQISK
ncbi:L,D-transpeptidase family protein [Lacimicrobium alkaliphilum]|uniref:L,D-transpeptidase family protein n=1 Tax=Lacimicrobium alkaliphilum TaxID=1526571 RepID=UPI0018D23CFF|nr:L,D-transpeptidase family protein [Lacimicrobium alkaliphilum]